MFEGAKFSRNNPSYDWLMQSCDITDTCGASTSHKISSLIKELHELEAVKGISLNDTKNLGERSKILIRKSGENPPKKVAGIA